MPRDQKDQKDQKDQTPWVVKGVPEHTRRQVKVYAARHDMTMGRAVEVMVESVHRRHDRQLLDMLLNLYRAVKADDIEEAKTLAQDVRRHLSLQRRQWERTSGEFADDADEADDEAVLSIADEE